MKAKSPSDHSALETLHTALSLVITGVGLVTPLGVGVDATWNALLAGQFITDTGRAPIERDAKARVSQLALLAAREAIGTTDVRAASLFVGTSKGPVDEWLAPDSARIAGSLASRADPQMPIGLHTLANDLACELRIEGPRETLSAACASGLHALARACLTLKTGAADRAVVVGSESSLHPIWHGTFKRLGVLTSPGEPCRPFDVHRSGFIISEAAAAIVIERRPARAGEIVIEQTLIAADTTHLTSSDSDARSLKHLLSKLFGSDRGAAIGFIHAHATATASDDIERSAIRAVLESEEGRAADNPVVYSHKGAIGHTLGASGLIALAINTRVHLTGRHPPMPTTRRLGDHTLHIPLNAGDLPPLRASVALAAGFGGAIAGVRLRSVDVA